jgi:hypothetical protein
VLAATEKVASEAEEEAAAVVGLRDELKRSMEENEFRVKAKEEEVADLRNMLKKLKHDSQVGC